MQPSDTVLLQEGLEYLGIEDPKQELQTLLTCYIGELEIFNAAFNLVKVQNTRELIIKHILDSLAPWKVLEELIADYQDKAACTVADIGSGAGLPGIPLACLFLVKRPTVQFTLIERMHKRCTFLENIQAMLALSNTTVLEKELEKVPAACFDIAVFRAFRPLDCSMFTALQERIKPNAILAAYKGKRSAIEEEMQALRNTALAYRIIPVHTPFYEAERNLVIISKDTAGISSNTVIRQI